MIEKREEGEGRHVGLVKCFEIASRQKINNKGSRRESSHRERERREGVTYLRPNLVPLGRIVRFLG